MSLRNRIFQIVYRVLSSGVQCSAGNILLGRGTGAGFAQEITLGSGLTITGGVLTLGSSAPLAHAASHEEGGSDEIEISESMVEAALGLTKAGFGLNSISSRGSNGQITAALVSIGNSTSVYPILAQFVKFETSTGGGVTLAGTLADATQNRVHTFQDKTGTVAHTSDINLANTRAALGIPSYANLTAANAALTIGRIYYDETLAALNTATA